MRVHVVADPEGDFGLALTRHLASRTDLVVTVAEDSTNLEQVGDPIRVLVAGRPSEEMLDRFSELEWVVVPFAGIPPTTAERLEARPALSLTNLHHNAAPTAEHAIALLLAASRQIVLADRALRGNDWTIRYDDHGSMILAGRRALLLGVGAIGRRVARVLTALDVEVRGVVRTVEGHAMAGEIPLFSIDTFDAALPETDLLICTLPDTAETRGLLDARRLGLLPEGAILVNVGRGKVIEEQALYAALEGGPLAAAGIDVWYQYPEEKDARSDTAPGTLPFASLDNLVLSPHRAGHGQGIEQLRAEHLVNALEEIAAGARGALDLSRGY